MPRGFGPAVIVAICTLAAVAMGAAGGPARTGNPTASIAAHLVVGACLVAGVAAVLSKWPLVVKVAVGTLESSLAIGLSALVMLSGSDFGPAGVGVDQSFRTATVTRFIDHGGFPDFAYKGLHAWYPPLNFWVLARYAELFGLEGWRMVKLAVVATAFLVPVVLGALWSRVVAGRALLAVVVAATVLFQSWWEWYAWLAVTIFVPWWLWAVLGVGRVRPMSWVSMAVAAALGAACFAIYPYCFFVCVVQLPLWALGRRLLGAEDRTRPSQRYWPTGLAVLGGSAVLSAFYWLPLLSETVRHGYDPVTSRYYSQASVDIPFPILDTNLRGVLSAIGLAFLLWTARRSLVSMAC